MPPQELDLEAASDRAFRTYEAAGFRGLSEDDQLLVAIWGLEADVNNGGVEQFYFNSSGDSEVRHELGGSVATCGDWTSSERAWDPGPRVVHIDRR